MAEATTNPKPRLSGEALKEATEAIAAVNKDSTLSEAEKERKIAELAAVFEEKPKKETDEETKKEKKDSPPTEEKDLPKTPSDKKGEDKKKEKTTTPEQGTQQQENPQPPTTQQLTEILAAKDAKIATLQKDFTEKVKNMEATQKELEKQVNATQANLTKQLTERDMEKQHGKQKKEKKQSNISRNPVNRVVGTAASVGGGIGAFVQRLHAKIEEIGAEPSQLFTKQFRKDLGHTIKKTPKQVGKTLTGGFRKHEQPTEMRNMQKSYTPSWSRSATKGQSMRKRIPKAARWLARKPVKVGHRVAQTMGNMMGDTFDIIKHTKISGNPKKWNFWRPGTWKIKDKFTRTRRSWHMLTHRDGKATEAA